FSARDMSAAEKAGFDTSKTWYHGTTAKDFKSFKMGREGNGVNELGVGIYFTGDPGVAQAWAGRLDQGGRVIPAVLKKGEIFDSSQKVDRLALAKRIKAKNPVTDAERQAKQIRDTKSVTEWTPEESRIVTYAGSELWRTWLLESDQALADQIGRSNLNVWLDRAGYIGRKNDNTQIKDQVVVFRSEYVRSPWAKFNPKKADSGNLLYSARDPQTETEAFKKWFDGSKVVTASGDPQVVYHGTDGDFTEFDAGKSGKNYRSTGGQRGIFFTSSPSTASVYAEQPAGAVLNPGNPDGADFGDGTANIMPVYLSLQNPLIVSSTKSPDKYFDYNRDSIYARADKAGADGIIVRGKGAIKRDLFVAFKSSQVKSAIGNDGGFGGGGDIRYSIRNGNSLWDEPTASRFDDFVYKAQDKLIDLKRVVQSIKKSTGAIADDINAYLQEELFHGRAAKRAHDFGTQELTPLMEQLAADGLTIGDIEEYLHARHANEANRVIADRNPGVPGLQDGGSGMKDADADAYFANLPAALRTKLQAAAAKVDAINDKTRQLYVDYGLESQDTVDSWKSLFKHYIPLQRDDKDGRGGMGIGQGFSVNGKETKGRTGSTRKVVDILANIAMQRERLIVRGEKNRVAAALVGLAAANPNPDFWSVGAPPAERVYDPKTNTVVDRVDPMYKSRDNVVVAKLSYPNGEVREMAVVFNEDDPRALRMAHAMKNLDAGKLEGILGVSAKITRYFSSINTQYNPVFGVVNLVRDVQGAMLNLGDTPLAGKRVRIARDTLSALRAIYGDLRAERRGGQATSPWAALWEEFVDQGGKTGYRELFRTSKDRADALQGILTPDAWMDSKLGKIFTANGTLKVPMSQAKKGADWIFSWLSDYNEAMENGVRLAAYKSALDKGMSKRQAASLAKNLTVNFNRKGQMGMQAGAVYAFFNAAMQGSARIGQTVFDMDGNDIKSIRLSKTGKQVVYGGILLGAIQAVALAWAGFDDEDPPEFVRERSLVIPIGDKKYLSIPMPLGFHVIPGIGRHAVEFALSGFEKPAERMVTMLGMFADGFNPIGNAGLSMQTLAPTALDPLVALTENRDWTGKPIARTSMNKAIPGHALHKDTASTLAKLMAEAVNAATGGNEYVAGAMSPTPDQIDYLIGQVTGGVGRELSKVEQTGLGVVRGENVPIFKMPLVGRFIGDAGSQSSEGTAFYSNVAKLNELETEIKGLQGDGRAAEAQQLRAGRPDAYLIAVANTAERQVQRLRREKRALIEAGAPRERVKAIEESITQAMARLNRAAEKVKQ
ncbi:MAG: LPD38 domain-containing protein, partial [Hydrogenophaga sp.]|nr:LPD38 domain-containing protein [Hydrogenophaga sp.]